MRFFIALLLSLIAFAPSVHAANELQGSTIQEVMDKGKTYGATVEKLNAADVAKCDKALGPRPIENADIYILTLRDQFILTLVTPDGVIALSSSPQKIELLNKILGRTGA